MFLDFIVQESAWNSKNIEHYVFITLKSFGGVLVGNLLADYKKIIPILITTTC